jgi:hypothetical protein
MVRLALAQQRYLTETIALAGNVARSFVGFAASKRSASSP